MLTPILRIDGRALPLRGANIDTDRIIPARFLRTVSFEGLERHAFEDDRAALASRGERHPFDDPRFEGASILVVNANFGCGSSREHAPQALYRRGVRAVMGESFSEIFFGNATMLGMPCVTAAPADVAMLQERIEAAPRTWLSIDLASGSCTVSGAAGGAVADATLSIGLPPNAREALTTGAWDATALLLDRYDEVERVASKLPYL
ncbi:MAG: 3-isopropylmalate dehydratase small subunit [Vicinamibacterales bacterium]